MKLPYRDTNTKNVLIYVAIALLAAFALFYNIDDRLLWGDEAETALLAVNINKYKLPTVTDGKNFITLLGLGHDSNKDNIWVWSPWLDEYIAAASFFLFGKNTFTARLPFVLIAFLSVLFFVWMAYKIFNNHEMTIFATLLYVTNVPFLLHARQCRYYALIIFAQIWMIYGYQQLTKEKYRKGVIHITIALTVQFYCNYIVVPGNILSLYLAALLIFRTHRHLLRALSTCIIIFAILIAPWLIYAQPWDQTSRIGLQNFGENFIYYLSSIHFYIVPLALFIIPLIVYCANRSGLYASDVHHSPVKDTEILLWVLIPIHILLLCVTPGGYFRYITPLIPVLILLASNILVNYIKFRIIRNLLVAALCLSNIVAVLSAYPERGAHCIKLPFVQFVSEITSDYEDRLEDVVTYFRQNAESDESVFVFDPEFPLIFYTDMRIVDGRFKRKIYRHDLPDWILTESASGVPSNPSVNLAKSLIRHYKPITITVHDTLRGGSRPDPHVHAPFTTPKMKKTVIYKKIE